MKRFKWIPKLSFFGGLLTYMTAAFRGLDLLAAMEKAVIATVVLYGLSIFSMMAYYQVTLHEKKPQPPKSETDPTEAPPGHGMEGAS